MIELDWPPCIVMLPQALHAPLLTTSGADSVLFTMELSNASCHRDYTDGK
jgi:hypothetical protein